MDVRPDVSITVEARVSPSEDAEKVLRALSNVAGDCDYRVERREGLITLRSRDPRCLRKMRDQLRDRRVRAAARRLFEESRSDGKARLMLNRQAAYVGVLVLCGSEEESPLGPIHLTIESENLDSVIEWLTAYESG